MDPGVPSGSIETVPPDAGFRIGRRFLDLARKAACHDDPDRWALLYRMLWRVVLATLWSVDDATSDQWMVSFYRRLQSGAAPAEALRQAQIEMLRDKRRGIPTS